MRALMVLGLGQQLEREACALAALASVTVVTLHLPLRLTGLLLPRMLPLQFSLTSPFAEAPTDLLLFHFLLPLTVPRLRIRHAPPSPLLLRCPIKGRQSVVTCCANPCRQDLGSIKDIGSAQLLVFHPTDRPHRKPPGCSCLMLEWLTAY